MKRRRGRERGRGSESRAKTWMRGRDVKREEGVMTEDKEEEEEIRSEKR